VDFNFEIASTYVVNYYPHVEVRFLTIGDTPINDFETLPEFIVGVRLVDIFPRPDAHYTSPIYFTTNVNLKYAAWGTCTTPSVAVPFALKQSDLPSAPGAVTAPGGTATFNLTLTGCPRTHIRYFFRAPAGIPVDNDMGVVGLDSTPGNAQGVGIQLSHNGGVYGTLPVKFNQNGNTRVYSSLLRWGLNSPTGVTHTIPMRATVYRTSAAPVVPGKINASVLVYIQYP